MDLHFHGAFGIDLMRAEAPELNLLAKKLFDRGIAAFCPTTLSVPAPELAGAVARLGEWITSLNVKNLKNTPNFAIPLGIHLEGPFISSEASGAHPSEAVRPLDMSELEKLWQLSRGTLKIITLAPEILKPQETSKLVAWGRDRQIILALGHSRATREQSQAAFLAGFTGVTHAWNAMPFHHRTPGPLAAALGRKGTYLELIIDQQHVSTSVIRWTRKLHGKEPICFVSDCAPATGLNPQQWASFGPLKTHLENGACRLADGTLAGGGLLLSDSYKNWVEKESQETGLPILKILKESLKNWSEDPLNALQIELPIRRLVRKRRVSWFIKNNKQLSIEYPT